MRNLFQDTMPDCALYWQIGIENCTSGRSLIMSQRTKQFDKKNHDALSIPSYVIKNGLKHGAKHGASEWQRMYYKAKETLQKARQPKHGGYKTILERWHKDDNYRKSLSEIGWTGKHTIRYGELALEDESVKETSEGNTPIHPTQRPRQRSNQQFEGLEEEDDHQVDPQTGWRTDPSKSRGNLRHPTSSSSSTQ